MHVVVAVDQQTHYMERQKDECNQNVLGFCDFFMIFTIVWDRWEGITYD